MRTAKIGPDLRLSKLGNASCSPRCLSTILFPLVPREAREFNTCVFCVLSSRGPFQPMKRCENCLFPRGRFEVKGTNCKVFVLQEDASFYFNLRSFSCQVQQEVFLTLVSDVFLNLSFDLPVLSPVRVVFVHLILILNWKLKIKSKIQNRLIPQELKITNLQSQLSIFVSKKDKIEKQFSMFWKSKNWKLKMVSWWLLFLVFKEKEN